MQNTAQNISKLNIGPQQSLIPWRNIQGVALLAPLSSMGLSCGA